MTAKNIPNLRFSEFQGEWINNKLGEIAEFLKGKGISKSQLDENGKTECITYGELYTQYGELIDKVKSRTSLSTDNLVISKANDVIIPASGETHLDIATASCVLRKDIALGGDLNIIRAKTNGVFLAYYLNNSRKNKIAQLAQGSSVIHLYSKQLKSLKLFLPSLPEQQKIASFLTAIDNRIQQLTRKAELLEQYKKGVMQQVFSQQIRFKNDNGKVFPDWEMKKLGGIAAKKSSSISANSLEYNSGEYKVYGASGLLTFVDFYNEKQPYISIVKDGAGVGRVLLCDAMSSTLGTLDIIKPKKGNNLAFLFYSLLNLKFRKYITGSTIPHIYFKDYSKEKIQVPTLPEQQKIANFLTTIDEKIQLTQQQLDKMQTYKKGLLQQMFV